jgi:hypothetical protein
MRVTENEMRGNMSVFEISHSSRVFYLQRLWIDVDDPDNADRILFQQCVAFAV